jgi:hypothetical protein
LLAEVLDASIHAVAEEPLSAVGIVAAAIRGVNAPVFSKATDAAITGEIVAVVFHPVARTLGALLTGDTILQFRIFTARVGGDAIVGPAVTHTALTAHTITRVGRAGAVAGAVGTGEALFVDVALSGIHAGSISAGPDAAVAIDLTGRLRDTRAVLSTQVPGNAVLIDVTGFAVCALAVVRITDAEVAGLGRAGIVFATSCCENDQKPQHHAEACGQK